MTVIAFRVAAVLLIVGTLSVLWNGLLIDHHQVTVSVSGTRVRLKECAYVGLTGRFWRLPLSNPSSGRPTCPSE